MAEAPFLRLKDLVGNGKPLPSYLSSQEKMKLISGNRMHNYPIDNVIGDDINVSDLVDVHKKRREQRQQIYEMVYRKCCQRIRYANDVQYVRECSFRVPEIQLWNGIPRYECKAVIAYIMIRLKQKGFDVKFEAPDGIMINWARIVANNHQSGPSKEINLRVGFDESVSTVPHLETSKERLYHDIATCKNECCSKKNPRYRDYVSNSAKKELEMRNQQDEIERLIAQRDSKHK